MPAFYELDLELNVLQRTFPQEDELNSFTAALSSFTYKKINKASLHYNETTKKYLATYTGVSEEDKPFVVNIIIANGEELTFEKIDVYLDASENVFGIPPILIRPRFVTVGNTTPFSFLAEALNDPTSWSTLSFTNYVSATNVGIVSGFLQNIGTYDVNVAITNEFGTTKDSITINVVDTRFLPTPMPTATPAPPTATPVPTSTPLPTSTPSATPIPTPTSTPFPTATPEGTPFPTPTPTIDLSQCLPPEEDGDLVNILNIYSAATQPAVGYTRDSGCVRCVEVTINANGDLTSSTQSGSTTNNLNLANLLINNGILPNAQGTYKFVFEFFGWRKQGVYGPAYSGGPIVQLQPPGWYSDDDQYKVWTYPSTAALLGTSV